MEMLFLTVKTKPHSEQDEKIFYARQKSWKQVLL